MNIQAVHNHQNIRYGLGQLINNNSSKLDQAQSKLSRHCSDLWLKLMCFVALLMPGLVHSQGLQKGTAAAKAFNTDLISFVTIGAAIILICIAIAYACKWVSLEAVVRWGIGCILAGSAAELVKLFIG